MKHKGSTLITHACVRAPNLYERTCEACTRHEGSKKKKQESKHHLRAFLGFFLCDCDCDCDGEEGYGTQRGLRETVAHAQKELRVISSRLLGH